MNIGIIGATGKLGNLLVEKLTNRSEKPTAIVRNKSKLTTNIPTIEKDIFDLTTEDIKDFDVVVNAFNAPMEDPEQFITSTEHLISILQGTNTRLVFAGGAGVLLVDENTMLVDTPEVPAEFKPIAEAEVTAFKALAEVQDFDWTYMAPPAMMEFDAPHTGKHSFSGNKLGVNADGKSFISYSDYADAFVEQIFNPENHVIVGVYA
ncbi:MULTISPECIES: NAD(P)-dependent oxidoreductase [Levilactobacillus]|uniref:NAD(P)-dependent oxidoreductase n=1 Tax=Levilactobacillus TaxID=2767886 RepID=UPI0021A55CAA|nr:MULTISPECIES: NAD(P)H-binding protein [Levilactobacillus]MCT3569365.1 hypothetical protein [Levilactobacillus brevis]MCT3577956.1 hypothetical protein [Levilactobacillus brevis]MCT3580552.1 hypothetical protein [Levilactobacillus brevis]MCT4486335.1 hypothetical protein [Levilactobacillus parabrevis]MCT4489130.1 hypothetical protein [Levilactobacillus parabrevis]